MSYLLWQRLGDISIATPRKVIRAADVPLFQDANTLCQRLQALNDAAVARIEQARDEARQAGRDEGFDSGVAEAQQILEERVIAMSSDLSQAKQQLRDQVAALALQVARKLIGGLADDERLAALAVTAAESMVPAGGLTLLVHPDQVEAVQQRLTTWRAAAPDTVPALEVRADSRPTPDTCRLETELGSIDASLDTQLGRLAAAWGVETNHSSASQAAIQAATQAATQAASQANSTGSRA